MASAEVVSGKALDVALGLLEQVGDHAVDAAMLKPRRFVAISSGGVLSRGTVSVRSVRSVAPSVGHGPCTVMPNGVGVSEQLCGNAAYVTAL